MILETTVKFIHHDGIDELYLFAWLSLLQVSIHMSGSITWAGWGPTCQSPHLDSPKGLCSRLKRS